MITDPAQLPDTDDLIVAVDTETSGLFVDDGARVSIVSLAWHADGYIEQAVFAFDQGPDTPLGPKPDLPPRYQGPGMFDPQPPNLDFDAWFGLMEWLDRQSIVMHNAKFDLHILAAGLRGVPASGYDLSGSLVWDTQVVNPLLWPLESASLKPTAVRLWGEQEGDDKRHLDDWLKRHGYRFDLAPWDLVAPYAGQDAVLTLRLYDLQQEALESGDLDLIVAEREIDLAVCLYRMERRGIGYDVDAAQRVSVLLEAMQAEADRALHRATGFRLATEDTMRRYWFDTLGLPVKEVTDKGKPAVTAAVVRRLVEQGVPAADLWQTKQKLDTAQSMWYGNWWRLVGDDGRLRTSYRQSRMEGRGTISGRLSVERVQLQAIPHDYQLPTGLPTPRTFFQPATGCELWECDLSQAEMRVAAGVAKCVSMIEGFARGDDAHSTTARLLFGIDESDPRWSFLRGVVAKRMNLGMIYGAGVDTLVAQIRLYAPDHDVTESQVADWRAEYRATFPELGRASRRAQDFVMRNGWLPLAGGRKRWFRWDERDHKAFNAVIQGGVAEMMKVAMIEVEAALPGVLLLQIHDSLVVEVPRFHAAEQVQQVQALMCAPFEDAFGVSFRSDAKRWA